MSHTIGGIVGKDCMCGGIGFRLERIPQEELQRAFPQRELLLGEQKKMLFSFFTNPNAILPVEADGKVSLLPWGNKTDDVPLPITGWAKQESLALGKWDRLHPIPVTIFADKGYEKGVWFDVPSGGFKGIMVGKGKDLRAYMVTKPADEEYEKLTHHDRQPVEVGGSNGV